MTATTQILDRPPLGDPAREESRIAAAYARRKETVDPRRYSYFNPAYTLTAQSRERQILRVLDSLGCPPLSATKILEVGCGAGQWLREFLKWGANPENLAGVDLLPERIAEARRLCPTDVRLECGSAATVDFPDAAFDLVLQATVFTSVLDAALQQQIAREMLRLVKPTGAILWYDFRVNNPRNPDVRGVGRAEVQRLFPGCRISLRPVTLAPPLARRLAPYSFLGCYLLEKIPFLCTHYLGVIRKLGVGRIGRLSANGGQPANPSDVVATVPCLESKRP